MRQFYLGIPRELEEAAIMDGASLVGVYYHVILPLARPIISTLAVFFFLANWNFFLWPLVVTTDPNLQVLAGGDRDLHRSVRQRVEPHPGGISAGNAADRRLVCFLPAVYRRKRQDVRTEAVARKAQVPGRVVHVQR
jgi:ABC-type glycerol-3-phosphate transport system permease component